MKKINIYSNKNINIISFIISIIIFLIIILIIKNPFKNNSTNISSENNLNQNLNLIISNNNLNINNSINNNIKNSNTINQNIISNNLNSEKINLEKNSIKNSNWYIEISSINLIAPIKETTTEEILNKYVGHFFDTPLKEGNICLAGHNRGYEKNYFQNLKNIKKGDKIKYKYNNFEKIYVVDIIKKIKNDNWDYLENTKKNKITLITCVENEPDYRLCVQATEK